MGIEAGDPASVRQLVTRLGSGSKMRCKLCRASLQKSRASQPKASCSGSPKGCGLTSIRKAGYTATKARAAGFTLAEIEDAGYVEGLMAAGYTAQEAKEAGYSSGEAKVAGFVGTQHSDSTSDPRA